jgi:Flp pilus assembly protein TadG
MKTNLHPRRGATLVEVTFVFPVVAFLILALFVGAAGIFRYQEVCYAAHEAARYASVRGTDYALETKRPAATPQDVYDNGIRPRLMTLDPARVSYSVTWDKTNSPVRVATDYEKPVGNTVTVTVTYSWLPELYLVGPITLTGSSTLPVSH